MLSVLYEILVVSSNNASEIIVLSLWETESDMEVNYHPSNRALNEFVDKASPLFEIKSERTDYEVSFLRI